jgi:hypothetical protein
MPSLAQVLTAPPLSVRGRAELVMLDYWAETCLSGAKIEGYESPNTLDVGVVYAK